jgi:hypothetical protein
MVAIYMSDFEKIVLDFFANYHDRKMKKWQGFFLSDHTQAIICNQSKRKVRYTLRKEMSQEEIGMQLLRAYSNHRRVHIQVKIIDSNDQLSADITGIVEGYNAEVIIVDGQQVKLDDINNIKVD